MLRWLAGNLWNILLAIILAVVVWVVAVNEANPNREDVFQKVPVAFVNQPPDTVVYDASASTVDVTLSAPEATWTGLSSRVISATVDLSTPGQDLYPVNIRVVPESLRRLVRVVLVEPAAIDVRVEPRSAFQLPVEVNLIGEPAQTYRLGAVVTRPATVTVSGPASWAAQVARVSGDVSIQGMSQPLSQTLALKPLDADGRVVPNVALDPDRTQVTADIEQIAGFGDLTVNVLLTGTQASGYRLAGVEVSPLRVTVVGSPAAIAALEGFAVTEPVDITEAQADFEEDVALNLPSNVALFRQQTVRVRVKIEPILGSLRVPVEPITVGLQIGLSARVSPEAVDVILEGALPALDTIDLERDVRVILDLTDLGIGTHQIEVQVETPEGIVVQSILPSTVQVTIERTPRGTATPPLTPSPTPTRRP
jgi:YbbR domain-containing protein